MDTKLLDDQGIHERDDRYQSGDDQDVRENPGTGKEKANAGEEHLGEILHKTVDHFFPRFTKWVKGLTDIRNQGLIIYGREVIIWSALVMLLTKQEARKKITDKMRDEVFCENLKRLSADQELESVPHGDTVEYLCQRLKEPEIEKINVKMMKELLTGRVLERHRLLGRYYTIAIDGVHVHTFDYPHCKHCLLREDDRGHKRWMHYKLQASMVTESGLCLPVISEWIENEEHYEKQDCERKALRRLVRRLREYFPRLEICVLLDGLYANQPVFDLLKELRMQWIVVFKEGSMSFIYPWVMDIKRLAGEENIFEDREDIEIQDRRRRTHEERLRRSSPRHKKRTRLKETVITWMAGIEFSDERSLFNVMTCKETLDGQKVCDYVWLVSDGLKLSEDNVRRLVIAGRCRWKIENEGINILKNGGYHLKHLYSRDEVSLKVWHALINIAHLINQLIEHGSLISRKSFGAVAEIAQRMFEHLRYFVYHPPCKSKRFQIRLGWDTS